MWLAFDWHAQPLFLGLSPPLGPSHSTHEDCRPTAIEQTTLSLQITCARALPAGVNRAWISTGPNSILHFDPPVVYEALKKALHFTFIVTC